MKNLRDGKTVQTLASRLGGSNNIEQSTLYNKFLRKYRHNVVQYSTNQSKLKMLSMDKPLVVLCSA